MVWVGVSVLVMVGAGMLVLMSVLTGLVFAGLHLLALAVRRWLVAGLVPSTFVLPELPLPLRRLRLTSGRSDAQPGAQLDGQPGQEAAGQGAPA